MNQNDWSRREWLKASMKTAAAVGLGVGGANWLRGAELPKPSILDLTPTDVCTLTWAQTLGPCYYNGTVVRHDITESKPGRSGTPTRAACTRPRSTRSAVRTTRRRARRPSAAAFR